MRITRIYVLLVVGCTLLGAIGGLVAVLVTPTKFSADAQVILTPATSGRTGAAVVSQDYVTARTKSVSQLAASSQFIRRVHSARPEAAASGSTWGVSVPDGTTVVIITSSAPTANAAVNLASTVQSLIARDVSSLNEDGASVAQIYAQTLAAPTWSGVAERPSVKNFVVIGTIIGLAVGLAGAVASARSSLARPRRGGS